jgi:hypothetical protein
LLNNGCNPTCIACSITGREREHGPTMINLKTSIQIYHGPLNSFEKLAIPGKSGVENFRS